MACATAPGAPSGAVAGEPRAGRELERPRVPERLVLGEHRRHELIRVCCARRRRGEVRDVRAGAVEHLRDRLITRLGPLVARDDRRRPEPLDPVDAGDPVPPLVGAAGRWARGGPGRAGVGFGMTAPATPASTAGTWTAVLGRMSPCPTSMAIDAVVA